MQKYIEDFLNFVREQGIIGLAIAFVLGAAVSKLVKSFVDDIINPFIGIFLGRLGSLQEVILRIGNAEIKIGSFISNMIDFMIIAGVVYFGFKLLKLEKLDKKKEKK